MTAAHRSSVSLPKTDPQAGEASAGSKPHMRPNGIRSWMKFPLQNIATGNFH